MAIALVQSATGLSSVATTTAAFSTAPTVGNLVVLAFASDDYNGTPNAGWTQSAEMEQQTFHGGYVWWRISDGSNSLQYTIGSATSSSWVLMEFSGVDATPYDISEGQFQQTSTSSYTTANITPTTGDRVLVAAMGGSHSSQNLSGAYATWLNSFTAIANTGQAAGAATCMGTAYRLVTGNGSTAYSSGVSYPNVVQSKSGMVIAFKAAAAGGIAGVAAVTEAGDTAAGAGTIALKGTSSATEAGDTVSATGTVALKGAVSATEAGDTASAAGAVLLKGVLSATEAGDTVVAAGGLQSSTAATAAITESGDTSASTGAVALKASASATEDGDTASSSAGIAIVAAAAITEAGDSVAASGSSQAVTTAVLAVADADDTVSAAAIVRVSAVVSTAEAGDTVSSTGAIAVAATGATVEAGDTLSALSALAIAGSLAVAEDSDTASAHMSSQAALEAVLVAQDDGDTVVAVIFRHRAPTIRRPSAIAPPAASRPTRIAATRPRTPQAVRWR